MSAERDPQRVIGRSPDRLSLAERHALAGKFIALEIYTPKNLALRRIEAIGNTPEECIRLLSERGLDPAGFEITLLNPPY